MRFRRAATLILLTVIACRRETCGSTVPPPASPDAAPVPVVVVMDAAPPPPTAAHVQKRGPANVCDALKAPRDDDTKFERPAGPAATTEPCKTLAAKHAALVAGVVAELGDGGAANGPDKAALDAFRCVPAQDGAWATTFDGLAIDPESSAPGRGLTGRLAIARYGADGERVAAALPGLVEEELAPSSYGSLTTTQKDNFKAARFSEMTYVSALTVFDWDGDGQPEVFLRMSKKFHEGGSWYRGWIWTSRSGKVAAYGPAAELYPAAVVDADGDGRPDVLSSVPFADVYTSRGMGSSHLAEGPPLLAHSLDDGTFVFDDDVTKDAARCACPSRPAPFLLPPELDLALRPIVCARIWGLQTDAIDAAISQVCDGPKDGDVEPSSCLYRRVLEEFSSRTPLVHLP